MLSCLDMTNAQSSCSFDIDEFLGRTQACNDALGRTEAYTDVLGRTQACTHAHACNPSGPDKSHTHTCIHVHTQIMPSPSEPQAPSDDTAESVEKKAKKRPWRNDQLYCLHPGSETVLNGQGLGDCGFDNLQCLGNQSSDQKELPDCGLGNTNVVSGGNTSGSSKRKGGLFYSS
ncbi:UNVERIFIED_CONTAM: hypothetical protein Sradi_4669500 [Sesamum radiatum]|uniref:Uncharacterized protein n=1 Tax=Sesamum radiatum TaxID=300843 RepID=A0AAW2MTY2_SESRA